MIGSIIIIMNFEITVILHLVISFQIIPSSRQFTRLLSRISSKSNMRIILRMGCVGVRYRNNDAHLLNGIEYRINKINTKKKR